MKKEEIIVIAQILTAMKDSIAKLEEAMKKNDLGRLSAAKREIILFQKELDKAL